MAENQKKELSCEELVESHQASRMDQILPDLESLQDCFDCYAAYQSSVINDFYKDATGMKHDVLLDEWVESCEDSFPEYSDTDDPLTDEEKANGLKRSQDDQLDSDFDEWVWENYETEILDFIREFHQERLSELPLAISKTVQFKIELSYGGPQDYICLDWDPEGKDWTGGSYHYLDWFDGARRTFGYGLAEQIAEAFCLYPEE
ncbi:MAG: hypothetical protein ACTSW7_00625 [Candidatus Thorarchaeota archaeon]|nr:MAG: hypothetical protein DRQ25_16420 [Candidatus Fermentibacteria bacterium]HEC72593.1 hypothetical protein [Thermoplasmatales archaeon]